MLLYGTPHLFEQLPDLVVDIHQHQHHPAEPEGTRIIHGEGENHLRQGVEPQQLHLLMLQPPQLLLVDAGLVQQFVQPLPQLPVLPAQLGQGDCIHAALDRLDGIFLFLYGKHRFLLPLEAAQRFDKTLLSAEEEEGLALSQKVTGPSFVNRTCMSAPNRPASTG